MLGDIPASVSVLSSEDIRQSPAVVADDVLRQVPTFSLFRRTSSLSSHPTTQGVSLRGIGPSGVSRTLVLTDGVPSNDPFGGWVYWTRVPLESVDRIEVVDGASSSLYGNYAMGGVINIVSSPPVRRTLEIKPQYGSRNSPKIDVFGSDVWGKFGAAFEASAFDTEGFPIVVESERGLVDDKAAVNFRNLNVKLNYNPTSRLALSFRTGFFHEERDNGKHSTVAGAPPTEEANNTTWKSVSGGLRADLPEGSVIQASLFSNIETFRSNFLAVPTATPPRSIGRMTLNQKVPVKDIGGMLQWSRAFGSRNHVTAGTDWHWVDGDSEEDALDATLGTTVTLHRVSGGSQRSTGLYVQDVFTPLSDLTVTFSARLDHWRNYDGHNDETNIPANTPGPGDKPELPERSDTTASPRVAALYHLTDRVNVWGSVSGGFRAPTLNELYRQFRVGTTTTLPNFDLKPEHLVGGEGGVSLTPVNDLTVRFTMYANSVTDPVANVTIATVGTSVTQQRQNVGRTEIVGFQTDMEYRLGPSVRITAGYLHNHATVEEFEQNPALVGNYLPQVPKNRGSVQVAYADRRYFNAALDVQGIGEQFDDDLNTPTRLLPKYGIVNFSASRDFTKNVQVFFGVQNMLDKAYIVQTLPTTNGSPRLMNGGVRITFSGQ